MPIMHLASCCAQAPIHYLAAVQIVLALLLLRQTSLPRQPSLPITYSQVLNRWHQQDRGGISKLPGGATCRVDDQTAELRKLLSHAERQLKESQVIQHICLKSQSTPLYMITRCAIAGIAHSQNTTRNDYDLHRTDMILYIWFAGTTSPGRA